MTLPASWTLVTITGTFTNRNGNPATGYVTFDSMQPVTIGGVVIVPSTITAYLDANGQISVQLPSTNDPDLSTTGWTYTVTEHMDNGRATYQIEVPYTVTTLDLATVPTATPNPSTPSETVLHLSDVGVVVAAQSSVDGLGNLGSTGNGMIAHTGPDTFAARTITSASPAALTIADGDGINGNPTITVDQTLGALAGQNWAADTIPVGSGADTVVQLAIAANTFPARSSAGAIAAKPITDFGLSLVDDADAATARSTLDAVSATALANTTTGASLVGYLGSTIKAFLDNLQTASATLGAALVGFLQSGTGAVPRTVQGELRDTLSVMQFGASASASAATNTAAFSAAIDRALALGQSGIRVGQGVFQLDATITKTFTGVQGFAIIGDGADVTELQFTQANGNGFNFTMGDGNWYANLSPHNTVHFRNLSITSQADSLGTLVYLDGGSLEGRAKPPVHFDNVVFRSANLDKNPLLCVRLHDCGNVAFTNCTFNGGRVIGPFGAFGNGVQITATDGTTDPTQYNFVHCKFSGGIGIVATDYAEGIYCTNCEWLGTKAIEWNSTTGESGLHIVGGHVNAVDGGFDLSNVYHGSISNVLMFRQNASVSNYRHIRFNGGANFSINNNIIEGNGATGEIGIFIESTPNAADREVTITDNTVVSCLTGVNLGTNSKRVHLGENHYANCTTRYIDNGTLNYIFKRQYVSSQIITLTGGATTEVQDVAIPSGIFSAKPTVAILQSCDADPSTGTHNIRGSYLFDSASSISTNARFRISRTDGTNLPAGAVRFQLAAYE